MRQIAIAGLAALLVLFGCMPVKPTSSGPAQPAPGTAQSPAAPQGPGATTSATAQAPVAAESKPASAAPAPSPPVPPKLKDGSKAAPPTAAAGSSSQGAADSSGAVKPKAPAPRNGATTPAAAVGTTPSPVKPPAAAPPAAEPAGTAAPAAQGTPAAPTLDLNSLEERLKDTRAIGLFSKLSLKNQVDDLLDQFRAFHNKQAAIPLSALRQRYDLLLMKVLSLLQDGDPPLAKAISTSREAIWGILTDPSKFAKI